MDLPWWPFVMESTWAAGLAKMRFPVGLCGHFLSKKLPGVTNGMLFGSP